MSKALPLLVAITRRPFAVRGTILFTSIALFSGLIWLAGESALRVTGILMTGGGAAFGLSEAFVKSIPILLCALAVAVPGKMGLTNIGGEGQFLFGAVGATFVALALGGLPRFLLIPLMAAAGAVSGAAWGLIPGALRAATKSNEIVISLLLNYVAALLVLHLIHGPMRDPMSMGWPQGAAFGESARLSGLFGTRVHSTIFVALVCAFGLHWFYKATEWGLTMKVIGASPEVARYLRLRTTLYYIMGFALAGALAGIAGFSELSAIHGRLREGVSLGYGYAGFFVAWLCGHRFSLCIPASFLFALIVTGADSLQILTDLPFATVYIFQGILFIAVLLHEQYLRSQRKLRA